MDKRKNTWAYVKRNPEVNLQGELPPKGRKSWIAKKFESRIPVSHEQPKENTISERGSS